MPCLGGSVFPIYCAFSVATDVQARAAVYRVSRYKSGSISVFTRVVRRDGHDSSVGVIRSQKPSSALK